MNHDEMVERVGECPRILGMNNVVEVHYEYPIFDYDGQQVTQIDMWALNQWYCGVVEVKTHDSPKLRRKAVSQLYEGAEGLKKAFGFKRFRTFYVHDDFQVEELRDGEFSALEIKCLNHMLGLSANPLVIGNNCLGCEIDYDANHIPCNYDCQEFTPVRIFHS